MHFSSTDPLWLWFCLWRLKGVGPRTFWHLYNTIQDPHQARAHIQTSTHNEETCQKECNDLSNIKGEIITFLDPRYPPLLKEIPDPPPFLSVLGNIELLSRNIISIVGARNASYAGKAFAKNLAQDLTKLKIIVASGFARGIDRAAHEGALKEGTIAVMAGGINIIYPSEHHHLYHHIKETGLIISEMPFNQEPLSQLFPRRNRIVAGISQGIILIEAARRSGSLITADYANNFGRDVYAVPGFPSDPRAQGCNWLIKNGAILCESIHDIHHASLPICEKPKLPITPYQTKETKKSHDEVLSLLSYIPLHIDHLLNATHMPAPVLCECLTYLELEGLIIRQPGGFIVLNHT